jgi:hypothetical protein
MLFYDGVIGVAPSYQVPGIGAQGEEYSVELSTVVTPGLPQVLTIALENGTGDEYYEIRVMQIPASDMIDTTPAGFSAGELIPEHLDVVKYRGLWAITPSNDPPLCREMCGCRRGHS